MAFKIPAHLEAEWKQVVQKNFKGDEQAAFQAAISRFVQDELRKVPKHKAFDSALEKVQHRQSHTEEILSDGLSDALDKMKKRRERGLPI